MTAQRLGPVVDADFEVVEDAPDKPVRKCCLTCWWRGHPESPRARDPYSRWACEDEVVHSGVGTLCEHYKPREEPKPELYVGSFVKWVGSSEPGLSLGWEYLVTGVWDDDGEVAFSVADNNGLRRFSRLSSSWRVMGHPEMQKCEQCATPPSDCPRHLMFVTPQTELRCDRFTPSGAR